MLWMGVLCLVTWYVRIQSTAPQLNIFQKVLGTLPQDSNVMSKHVGDAIHNELTE
jgi:hypothetical protein